MQFKYIAALIASLAVNGALAVPVPDAEAMDAALQDAALEARAQQIDQANQWFDDDLDFLDWDKAKMVKRAEQAQQAKQGEQFFFPQGNFRFNAGFNFQNRLLFQQQPWLWNRRFINNRFLGCWNGWC